MPHSKRSADQAMKKKLEPVIKGVDHEEKSNLHRISEIRYFLEQVIGEKVSEVLITDIFNMLFLAAPQLKEHYPDENNDHYEAMKNVLSQLSSSPLRNGTVADVDMSTVATVNIIANLINSMKDMQQKGDNINEKLSGANLLDKLLEGSNGESVQDLTQKMMQMASAWGGYMPRPQEDTQEEINRRARQAAKDADNGENLDDLKDRAADEGHQKGKLEFGDKDPLSEYLSKHTDINQLLKLLNGLPELSSESSEPIRFSRGPYNGYNLGADFKSLAPIAHTYPKHMLYALYAHKKLPVYEHEMKERKKDKFILFDKSGSMSGDRLAFAKAVTLSMYITSLKDKSDFYLKFFDENSYEKVAVLKNAKREIKEAMIDYVDRVESDGGTNIQNAIISACHDLKKTKSRNKNQIILVTDGESHINIDEVLWHLESARAELITVYVNPNPNPNYIGPLRAVSTHFFSISSNPDEEKLLFSLIRAVEGR